MGTIHGGSGRNVIADEALMEIEVRGETTEINEYMSEYARNVLNGAAAVSYTHLANPWQREVQTGSVLWNRSSDYR